MGMHALCRLSLLLVVPWLAIDGRVNAAEPDANDANLAVQLLREAIQAEIDGDILARERLLIESESLQSQLAPAHWYQGRVSSGDGQWLTAEEAMDEAKSNTLLKKYEEFRSTQRSDIAGSWNTAVWCATWGLGEQCRAHLLNIVLRDPDHVAARMALGHVLVGNEWVTTEDQRLMFVRAERARAGFEKYASQINQLFQSAQHGRGQNQEAAWDELRKIDDPLAVPVMVMAAERFGSEAAMFVVDWLGDIDHPEAALALSRYAVFANDSRIKEHAVNKLKTKSLFDFVPEMLNAMSSPISFMTVPVIGPNGQLAGFRQAFAKEGMNENRVWNFDTKIFHTHTAFNRPVPDSQRRTVVAQHKKIGFDPSQPFGKRTKYLTKRTTTEQETVGGSVNLAEAANEYFAALAKAAAVVTSQMRETNARLENQAIERRNSEIAHVIGRVADVAFESVPKDVWAWWDAYNETDYQSFKSFRRRYDDAKFVVQMSYIYEPTVRERQSLTDERITYGSCFVAGTQISTLRGMQPIEKVLPGDLVLSRCVKTGELCFKPVVAATTRAPAKTVILQVDEEEIHATTSHLLWVCGKGWTKCGDIVPGDLLHSAAEPAVVMSKRPSDVLPTHNIVVADNHTYFVGDSLVLSHDVVPRKSAHELVPGQFAYTH